MLQLAGRGVGMLKITEREFYLLADYIKSNYGIHLKKEKMILLSGRLNNVLMQEGFSSFRDYYQHLLSDRSGEAVCTFVERITTNHTFFMREPDHFTFFREQLLPYLFKNVGEKDLRIWCAASSSGEEPYTLAMILDEFFGSKKAVWDTKVLATDISEKVLEVARKGIYSNERIAPLPPHWKKTYFTPCDSEHVQVIERIRKEVIYRKFNLMERTLPFRKQFHVIFCRNVMIYFDQKTKEELVNRLYEKMEYGGYLFIGQSESLFRDSSKFRYVMPSVYRKG
jgi:chemotaxis protein methyltransferase CheR